MNARSCFRSIANFAFHQRFFPIAIFFSLLVAGNALAFKSSLQPEEVDDAYSLGQSSNHEDVANFLNQYEHHFKFPSGDPIAFVQSVEFQTPYEQIVLRSLRTPEYSKFKAAEDYAANPRRVIVRVIVSLKSGYTGPVPPADIFKVLASQDHAIVPRNVDSKVLCDPSVYTNTPTIADCVAYTKEILLQFSARQFAPGNAMIKVTLPQGKSMETAFNLDSLK